MAATEAFKERIDDLIAQMREVSGRDAYQAKGLAHSGTACCAMNSVDPATGHVSTPDWAAAAPETIILGSG